jgi:hypothetical protein
MIHMSDGNTLHAWINDKQRLETELAWTLLETFNSDPGLIGPLRAMASQALAEFRALKSASPIASAAITQAWQSQIGIVPLCRKFPAGFNSIVVATLDAQECSDLIRLYGEFIEKAGRLGAHGVAGPQGDYALQDAIKSSYRVGADRWATEKAPARADVLQGYGRLREPVQAGLQATSDVHSALISMGGGAARFALRDMSTVNRIDRVFGLVPLADISGTTTDSLYFMERFSGPTAGDPVFYLLPLGTIVALGHHSLLEVALSLAINRIVDYRIGFYTTLRPAGAVRGMAAIGAALAQAEWQPRNRRMLIYFGRGDGLSVPGVPCGCFLYEPADFAAFSDFARGVTVLDTFPWMPAWPNESQLRDYCRARGLATP